MVCYAPKQGLTTQKTDTNIFTAVRTSHLIELYSFPAQDSKHEPLFFEQLDSNAVWQDQHNLIFEHPVCYYDIIGILFTVHTHTHSILHFDYTTVQLQTSTLPHLYK
jgi:hypothetical protein